METGLEPNQRHQRRSKHPSQREGIYNRVCSVNLDQSRFHLTAYHMLPNWLFISSGEHKCLFPKGSLVLVSWANMASSFISMLMRLSASQTPSFLLKYAQNHSEQMAAHSLKLNWIRLGSCQ